MINSNDNLNSKISAAANISKPWDKDNQAWWDWYVGLADNDVKGDEIINTDPLPNIAIPSDDEVISELAEPYHLTNDQIDFFKKNLITSSICRGKNNLIFLKKCLMKFWLIFFPSLENLTV